MLLFVLFCLRVLSCMEYDLKYEHNSSIDQKFTCHLFAIMTLYTFLLLNLDSCADRGFGLPPPLKNHKNIGFLSNTGPDPLKNHKASKPAINVGPSSPPQ